MILVIGAAGGVGSALSRQLVTRGAAVRAFVHSQNAGARVTGLGVSESCVGDFRSDADLRQAMEGCQSVFLVLPPFSEDEAEVGRRVISQARAAGAEHFVYQSVMHPQLRRLDHHARKLLVEEALIESGLAFTIVQPAMFMQNLHTLWRQIRDENVFSALCAPDQKLTLIDTEDLGEAIAILLTDPALRNATYELAGPDTLTFAEMAVLVGEEMGRKLTVVPMDDAARERVARAQNWSPYAVQAFQKMARHYDEHGFHGGNSNLLVSLLQRQPHGYRNFVRRFLAAAGQC